MKTWIIGLRIASIFLYGLSVVTALFSFELCLKGNYSLPALDRIWIASGVISLLLAFHVENVEQRIAGNGQDEQPVESKTALFAKFIARRVRSSSDAIYPNATPAE